MNIKVFQLKIGKNRKNSNQNFYLPILLKLRNLARQDSSLLSNVVVTIVGSRFPYSTVNGFVNNKPAHTYPLRTLAPHDSRAFFTVLLLVTKTDLRG